MPVEGTVLEKPLKDTVKFTKPHLRERKGWRFFSRPERADPAGLKCAVPWREHATARIDIQRVILYIGGSL